MAEESRLNKVNEITLRGRETTNYQHQYDCDKVQNINRLDIRYRLLQCYYIYSRIHTCLCNANCFFTPT